MESGKQGQGHGAAAYPPAMLLKLILFACSQGIVSNRRIERICREHVTASNQMSGTRTDFAHQAAKLEAAAGVTLKRHCETDCQRVEANLGQKEAQRITCLQPDAAKLQQWAGVSVHYVNEMPT